MNSRVETIYLRARELAGAERDAYLEQACERADDRQHVEGLLASQASASVYFDNLSNRLGGVLREFENDIEGEIPTKIGDYHPYRLLGRGGMGEVFLASRSDGQFDKDVAIKVLPSWLANPEAGERFRRERQILAQLDHPNICHLLDGGVTDGGIPYFVMEYISGLPIDEYCDQRQLSIEARLELFLQACSAVEHAHQRLTLHRDIKPANILVSETGQVKLLDFGIAKMLSEGDGAMRHEQLTAHLPVTPRFASPEQLRGESVSTRADVYGLGMLLYFLLTGLHSHRLQQHSMPESLRILSEQEATAASRRVRTLREEPDAEQSVKDLAKHRQQKVQGLIDRLHGDLDNILAKALRQNPAERYASVALLADDIRRHLDHRPVSARPDSLGYVAAKFIRRHRVPVALSGVITGLLLALSGGAVWTAWRQGQQAEAIIAESERADATKDFLISVFRAAHPNQAKGETVTALALVNSGADRVDQELTDRPALQAALLNTFADIYSLIGEYDRAAQLWHKELTLREQLSGGQSSVVAGVMDNLSRISSAQGNHQQAVEFAQRAINIRQSIDDPLGLAHSRFRLARLAHNANELDQAEAGYREVLATFAAYPQARGQHTMTLTMLGSVLRHKGQFADALPPIEQALAQQLQRHGEDDAFTAQILQDLGATQRALKETVAAERSYQRALLIAERLFGKEHREVAFALSGLANLAETNGNLELAEQRYLRALKIFEASLDTGHPNIAAMRLNLGAFYRRQNDCDRAEQYLRQGLELMLKALPSHRSVATGQRNLGHCIGQSNPAEAETLLLTAYQTQADKLGAQHQATRGSAVDLAALYATLERPIEAAQYAKLAEQTAN